MKQNLLKTCLIMLLAILGWGNAWADTSTVDFESVTATYTDWKFTNFTSKQTNTNVTAHGGSYFGTTGGTQTGSLQTNEKIVAPSSIVCYVSKQTTNTTSSTWKVQVSSNGTSWTDVKSQSATSMDRGTWVELSADLSSYSNVYVRIYYTGSTAVRCIDDVTLTYSNNEGSVKTLTSIAISGTPNKVTYKDGDTFDPTGLVVTGTYNDDSKGNLTAQASFNCTPSAMTLGTTSVSVTATVSEISSEAYNVAVTVNPNIDYVTLPWEWTGGAKADLTTIDGVTGYGLGTDYAAGNAPYLVKLDGTGDYIMVKTNEDMGVCTIKVKMLGGATTSTIAVQGSTNGTDFATVETLTISGEANSTLDLSTSGNLGADYRYVKFYFTKGSNVGVGGITIAKAASVDPTKEVSSISVTGTPDTFWKGDTFNHNGMTVTATYSDDSNEDVTSVAIFSGYDMNTAGAQTVTVTYGGQSDTYEINVLTIANTLATAYTTTQAKALIDAGKDLNTEVYITGVVSKVDSYNTTYKSITYWLDDNSFEVYGGLAAVGEEFSSKEDIEVGATVVVLGKITVYKGTYEFSQNNHLVSYEAPALVPANGTLNFVATNEEGYWATFSSDRDVIFPESDVVVYTVAYDGETLHIYDTCCNSKGAITDKTADAGWDAGWAYGYYVQANTGVLVYSSETSAKYYFVENNTDNELFEINNAPNNNQLRPASAAMTGDFNFYKLAYGDFENKTGLGFYWGAEDGAAFTCKPGTAYLAVPTSVLSSNLRSFTFGGECITGIKSIEAAQANTEIFNLQGQRVSRLQQGVNIVNGKKVIR